MTHHITDEQIDKIADDYEDECGRIRVDKVFDFARAVLALAAPQGEPIGYVNEVAEGKVLMLPRASLNTDGLLPLYTAPAPAVPGTAREFVEWMKAQPEDRDPTTIDGALAEFEAQVSPQPQAPAAPSVFAKWWSTQGESMAQHHSETPQEFARRLAAHAWAEATRAALTAAPTPPAQPQPCREAREAEQRARMNARHAARAGGAATADFDLPAPNDVITRAATKPAVPGSAEGAQGEQE